VEAGRARRGHLICASQPRAKENDDDESYAMDPNRLHARSPGSVHADDECE
jgi:hypothetical protein